jgi:hypothetical protein
MIISPARVGALPGLAQTRTGARVPLELRDRDDANLTVAAGAASVATPAR